MGKFTLIFIAFFFFSCGYQPISKISTGILGENVWVDVEISRQDPQNTVAIKDSVREGIIARLNRSLSPKNSADTIIIAKILNLTFSPILYDELGYVTAYKANLKISYDVLTLTKPPKTIIGEGEYDFKITRRIKESRYTDSVISDQDRFDAIKNASSEAFGEFISKLAIAGLKDGNDSK